MGAEHYIVRGAKIYCDMGTHVRKLDMPVSHGAYIKDKPMMNEKDCKVGLDQNIPPFGACHSESNEGPNIEIAAANPEDLLPAEVTDDGTWIPPAMPLKGKLCTPVLNDQWWDAHEETLVDGEHALTVASYITCSSCGGTIQFLDNGQGVG